MLEHLVIQIWYHTSLILQLTGCLIALCVASGVAVYTVKFTYEAILYILHW